MLVIFSSTKNQFPALRKKSRSSGKIFLIQSEVQKMRDFQRWLEWGR